MKTERIARNSVTSILDSNDVEVFAREEIERAHVRFYSDLFSKEPIDAIYKQICLDSIDKFLSPPQRDSCEGLLSTLIRRSPEISGFQLPGAKGQQARVRLYADMTTCVIKDVCSLTKLFECVNVYELGSGGKLNRSKTEAMWLGAWMSRTDEPLDLTWVRKMKVLGVVFGTVSCEEDNWQPKISWRNPLISGDLDRYPSQVRLSLLILLA